MRKWMKGLRVDEKLWRCSTYRVSGCWTWNGAKARGGYGMCKTPGYSCLAHRAAYQFYNGPIPDGFDVHHKCGTRNCWNPRHLQLLPLSINRSKVNHGLCSACGVMLEERINEIVG